MRAMSQKRRWTVVGWVVAMVLGAGAVFSPAIQGAGDAEAEAILEAVIDNLRGGTSRGLTPSPWSGLDEASSTSWT